MHRGDRTSQALIGKRGEYSALEQACCHDVTKHLDQKILGQPVEGCLAPAGIAKCFLKKQIERSGHRLAIIDRQDEKLWQRHGKRALNLDSEIDRCAKQLEAKFVLRNQRVIAGARKEQHAWAVDTCDIRPPDPKCQLTGFDDMQVTGYFRIIERSYLAELSGIENTGGERNMVKQWCEPIHFDTFGIKIET